MLLLRRAVARSSASSLTVSIRIQARGAACRKAGVVLGVGQNKRFWPCIRIVGVEDPEHVAEARSSALGFIAGHTVGELEDLAAEIFEEAMADKIWPGTKALAQLHLDEGQRVWLVTDKAPLQTSLMRQYDGTTMLRVDPAKLAAWLPTDAGTTAADHLYMIDPLGDRKSVV